MKAIHIYIDMQFLSSSGYLLVCINLTHPGHCNVSVHFSKSQFLWLSWLYLFFIFQDDAANTYVLYFITLQHYWSCSCIFGSGIKINQHLFSSIYFFVFWVAYFFPTIEGIAWSVVMHGATVVIFQVWKQKKVWEGFIKCCQRTKPQSFQVLLQLPPPQLSDVLTTSPDLQQPLLSHVMAFTENQVVYFLNFNFIILNLNPNMSWSLSIFYPQA